MKQLILIVIAAIMMASCTQTTENKVEKEFKEYINLNFNNPKDVLEIVSIESGDTLTFSSIKSSMLLAVATMNIQNSHFSKEITSQMKDIEKILTDYRVINNADYELKIYIDNYIKSIQNRLYFIDNTFITDGNKLIHQEEIYRDSTIDTTIFPDIYETKIKYRQKIGDDVVLKTYYSYHTSKKKTFSFQKHPIKVEEISQINADLGKMAEIMSEGLELIESNNDICNKVLSDGQKVIHYVNLNIY